MEMNYSSMEESNGAVFSSQYAAFRGNLGSAKMLSIRISLLRPCVFSVWAISPFEG